MRKFIFKEIYFITGIILVFLGSLLNMSTHSEGHWAAMNLLGSDGAADVISAISYHYGLGVPYKDYWDYRPPGFIMLVDFWVRIFGFKIFSFKLMELVFRFGIGLEICFLARKIFSPFQAFVVTCFTNFVFFAPIFGTMMLAEPYGLFFSLLGLLILLYVKNFNRRYFFASFFIFLSGQVKDPFAFSVLVYVPVFLYLLATRSYRSFFRAFILTVGGFLLVLILFWSYLMFLGSWEAYKGVFLFKSSNFSVRIWEDLGQFFRLFRAAFEKVKEVFFRFQYVGIPLLFLWFSIFIYFLLHGKLVLFRFEHQKNNTILTFPSLNFTLTSERLNRLIVVFFSIGVFIGFTLNQGFSPHYLTMVVVPMFFLWSIVISSMENRLRAIFKTLRKNLIFLPAVFLFLFPKDWITNSYGDIPWTSVFREAYVNITMPDGDTIVENYINSKTSIDDCMISLYGWKSAEAPLYSMRRPCSRIIQANLVNHPLQVIEYREAIFKNPPAVVVYSLAAADMNVLRFDREVINFTEILKKCYKQDNKYTYNGRWPLELYFPVYSGEVLRNCVKNNATI